LHRRSNSLTNATAKLTAIVAISGTSSVVTVANTQINRSSTLETREQLSTAWLA
jgi:hypothetical protein